MWMLTACPQKHEDLYPIPISAYNTHFPHYDAILFSTQHKVTQNVQYHDHSIKPIPESNNNHTQLELNQKSLVQLL